MISQSIENLIIYKDCYLEQRLHIKDRNVFNHIKTFVQQSEFEDKLPFITMGYWILYCWNRHILRSCRLLRPDFMRVRSISNDAIGYTALISPPIQEEGYQTHVPATSQFNKLYVMQLNCQFLKKYNRQRSKYNFSSCVEYNWIQTDFSTTVRTRRWFC